MKIIKKIVVNALLSSVLFGASVSSHAQFNKNDLKKLGGISKVVELSQDDIIAGLKDALDKGINNATSLATKQNGFWNNPLIKVPFPEDAIFMKQKLSNVGFSSQIQEFEEHLNKAAEVASKKALPIFKKAITSMNIKDGLKILDGSNSAATTYLKNKTTGDLTAAFTPVTKEAIDKVQLTRYWKPLTSKYNRVTRFIGGKEVNTDLEKYVTQKTIEGLFKLLAEEEAKIRKDPAARTTDILKKVFKK